MVLAPWIVISVVSILLLSGVSAGYAWLVTRGCSGPAVEATVVSSPALARILDNLSRRWADTEPAVDERCAAVKVVSKNAAEVAQALGPGWDPRRDGPQPHAWVPDSTAWLKLASTRDDAARMIPDRQPSLARSPAVIGMPMPMAKALGWPNAKLSWARFGSTAGSRDGWARLGHPEWGAFKIGMTNPVTSTAGLHALTGVADSNDDGRITDAERQTMMGLSRAMHVYADEPAKLIGELTKRDLGGEAKVLTYLSGFPILEHDVRAYNDTNPRVPLAAVYPTDGTSDADYPYLTLDAPWSKPADKQVVKQFLDYLRGPDGRQTFHDNFYRDPNRRAGKHLTESYGVTPRITTLPRAVMLPDSVSLTLATWVASNRPTNVLFVLDVSESMNRPVKGTGHSRMDIAGTATARVVNLLGDDARVGLWAFSSRLGGTADHRELTSLGPLEQTVHGTSRRAVLRDDLRGLPASGPETTGVYDTALAAYQYLARHHVPDATNLVVLISDGRDDKTGLSLHAATAKLKASRNAEKPSRLVTIGYGPEADMAALDRLASATGGRSYHAQYETDIDSLLVTALFNT
ncbi:MAG TPA: substrate-binding domain-containing protein [Micromonosporaceae bacterium]